MEGSPYDKKKQFDSSSHFDTIPACDRWTHNNSIYRASKASHGNVLAHDNNNNKGCWYNISSRSMGLTQSLLLAAEILTTQSEKNNNNNNNLTCIMHSKKS